MERALEYDLLWQCVIRSTRGGEGGNKPCICHVFLSDKETIVAKHQENVYTLLYEKIKRPYPLADLRIYLQS